ncbi:N-acetyltransferase [uncultured Sneathiella sp.]|jgi:predicted N-acetyltransferase YhbS|uniref:GNAT family N-acetyltransferase n=1 Tax=uncultured Sneathiella sp. TaxID=879315 RepID=UPI0030DD1CD3|tara:strand:- start:26247 stop:26831 length:585 start_codon:yes stop_codon:yes gene_type:complete
MPQFIQERPGDAALIEPLLDECFGPDRFKKTAYKVRENIAPQPELSYVAVDGERLLATIRYWPITIGGKTPALLLGPIAVSPRLQGKGIGVGLIRETLQVAQDLGHRLIVLVGDPEYYGQFGFENAARRGFLLPGPVEERRFLVKECVQGALKDVSGMLAGAPLTSLPPGRVATEAETERLTGQLAAFSPPADA